MSEYPTSSVPRIAMLSEAQALERGRQQGIDDYISRMNLFRVLLHRPALAGQLNGTIMALVGGEKVLGDRLRELIIMRVSWLTGCDYEWVQHWQASLYFGLTESELAAVRDWRDAPVFDSQERAALAATDELVQTGAIGPECWRALSAEVDDESLLEVVACIANWHMFAQLLRALEVPLEPGLASWPPDGKAPVGSA